MILYLALFHQHSRTQISGSKALDVNLTPTVLSQRVTPNSMLDFQPYPLTLQNALELYIKIYIPNACSGSRVSTQTLSNLIHQPAFCLQSQNNLKQEQECNEKQHCLLTCPFSDVV